MVSLASTEKTPGVVAPSAGGSLKRKKSDTFDSGADLLSSSQIKRRRVTFDPTVDIHILPDVNEKSQELVGEEVRRALDKHADNDSASYDEIRSLLVAKPTSAGAPLTRLLHKYIVALSNNVPLLDHRCSGMVHAIVDCHWLARNEHFVRSYRNLLRSLLSVQPGYTSSVLTMLVGIFLRQPSPAVRQQDDPVVPRALLQSRVHDCLKYLLRQNPMSSTLLAPIMASLFPSPADTAKTHVCYIENILKVAQYCREIKGSIYSLIMEKLVKIDAQIQVDLDEFEDDIDELLTEEAADDPEAEEMDSDDESVSSDGSLDPEELRAKEVRSSIMKLDAIMDLLFSHYDSIFKRGDLSDMTGAYDSLIAQFTNIILPTYRSRHAQFLLFHFSQMSSQNVDIFAGICNNIACDKSQPRIVQIAAAAYLASFIARGAHVSTELVREVFDVLCSNLEQLREEQEPLCTVPNLQRFGLYYAMSQALLYAFCFRWRDLIVTEDGNPPTDEQVLYHEGDFHWYNDHYDIQGIFRRNIFSKLNPLKICAPTIVAQFARVAHHLRFLYVFPLIETNKRIRLARSAGRPTMDGIAARETALSMKAGEQAFLLDAYFPFDPYLLPRSKRWIAKDYVEWKHIPGMEIPRGADEEEEDEDEYEDDESDISDSDREPEDVDDQDHEDLDDDTSEPSL